QSGGSDGRHTAQGMSIHDIADGHKARRRGPSIRVGRYMPRAGLLPVLPCPAGSTRPTGSSHRTGAAGTAPYGKKNGGKSPRSQAGWGPTGVSHLVRNEFSVASRPLTRHRRAVLRGSG